MDIIINSVEYQCWHEVGHATACLHFGGDVEFIEFLEADNPEGKARARCITTPDIRPNVACGGFAAELMLYRAGCLEQVDEKKIVQVFFFNATKDRQMLIGRPLRDGEEFSTEFDTAFKDCAMLIVEPILGGYFTEMHKVVRELRRDRRLEGARVREILLG